MSMKNTYADIPNLLFSAATISIGLMASIHLLVIYKTDSRGINMYFGLSATAIRNISALSTYSKSNGASSSTAKFSVLPVTNATVTNIHYFPFSSYSAQLYVNLTGLL